MLQQEDNFILHLGSNSNFSCIDTELLHQKEKSYFRLLYKCEITIFTLMQGDYNFYLPAHVCDFLKRKLHRIHTLKEKLRFPALSSILE